MGIELTVYQEVVLSAFDETFPRPLVDPLFAIADISVVAGIDP